MIPLYFAPLQGYTDDAYRRFHQQEVGGATAYYTPFVRWEHGGVRSKDLRDVRPDFNEEVPLVVQVIAASIEEFRHLLEVLTPLGHRRIDLNMGCPFQLQARHGRGAGLLGNVEVVREILNEMNVRSDFHFSVKLRLGWDAPNECMQLLPLLNDARLVQVTLHPRLGIQGYKGTADIEAFAKFAEECRHPLVFNGDIRTPQEATRIMERFPTLHGLMIGRGWLARPSLGRELTEGREWSRTERMALIKRLHDRLHAHYAAIVPGDAALHQKLKTYWDYMEEEVGRKCLKKLKKAGNLNNYLRAVSEVV